MALLLAALGAVTVVFWAQELWLVQDWRTPLSWYEGGDALVVDLMAHNIQETGWYQENPRLGAPAGLELYSWPGTVLVPMLLLKLLGAIIEAPGAVVNAYYLLGWPLAALIAAWAFLRLGIRPPLATGLAIVFASLPAHTLRGETHLFLATLALVPPGLIAAHSLARGGLSARGRIWALAFALILGASEAYYGFFASFLVLAGAIIGWFAGGGWRRILDALAFGLAAALGVLAAILPSLLHGEVATVARTASAASVLGLKLGQLLLPVPGHRLEVLAQVSRTYIRGGSAPGLDGESVASPLGFLGSVGVVLLLAHLLGARFPSSRPESSTVLARLSLPAILFATVGGLGSIFVTFVHPQIRAHNRMSVFIGFLSLAGLGLLLDALLERTPGRSGGRTAWVLASALALFGAWDQSSVMAIPRHRANASAWAVDRDWVGRAEASMPEGAMVFQLPWVPFPESPTVHKIFSFDALRPILQSRSLRWSYGATKNSETDLWQRKMVALPSRNMVSELRRASFAAIVIDRWGYLDQGNRLVTELQELLGPPTIESSDHRWILFPLATSESAGPPAAHAAMNIFSDSFESGTSGRWPTIAP